jgi:hypothetical protein
MTSHSILRPPVTEQVGNSESSASRHGPGAHAQVTTPPTQSFGIGWHEKVSNDGTQQPK